jgi:monoterpene epsilon-lactone hydrolase
MSKLNLLIDLVQSACAVAFQRCFFKRIRPTWTFGKQLLVHLFRKDMDRIKDLPVEKQRAYFEARARAQPNTLLRKLKMESFEIDGLEARWFIPKDARPGATLVYWHGGGFCFCSINTHAELISRLALASQCRTLAVNYRLAPEFPYPAALDDALTVMRFLRENGYAPEQTVIAGDSAGGNLCLASLFALEKEGAALPAGCVGLSPWVDLDSTRPSQIENQACDYVGAHFDAGWRNAYLGDADSRDPLISVIHGNYANLPPILLHAGGAETLRDDIKELAQIASTMGADVCYREWPDMVHVWHLMGLTVPQAKEAIAEIGAFVKQHSGAPAGE